MDSAKPLPDVCRVNLGTITPILQPEVDAFLETIHRTSTSLVSNASATSQSSAAIALCDATEFAIRRQRNTRVAINRLTIDVIHDIFAETADLHRIHDIEFPVESIEDHRKQLYCLRCVSVWWNTFILSSPMYWTAINFGVSLPVMERTLRRAETVALCLFSLELSWKRSADATTPQRSAVLADRLSQIRSIRTNEPKVSTFCQSFITRCPSNLTTIQFRGRSQTALPLQLRSLRQIISVVWLPRLSQIQLRGLHKLTIDRLSCIDLNAVKLIAECTSLVFLSIHTFGAGQGSAESTELTTSLSLPLLQDLSLKFGRPNGVGLITHRLKTPSSLRGSLTLYTIQHNSTLLVDDFFEFILPSNAAGRLPGVVFIGLECASGKIMPRTTFSVGRRRLCFPIPTTAASMEQYRELFQAIQSKLKHPPITLELADYPNLVHLMCSLASLNVRILRTLHCLTINDVLALIGSYDRSLPSGTPNTSNWPFESLQELTIEYSQVNVKQLTRIMGIRQRYLRTTSRTWLKNISLVNCKLIGMPFERAEKELGKMGVTLTKTGCTYSRYK